MATHSTGNIAVQHQLKACSAIYALHYAATSEGYHGSYMDRPCSDLTGRDYPFAKIGWHLQTELLPDLLTSAERQRLQQKPHFTNLRTDLDSTNFTFGTTAVSSRMRSLQASSSDCCTCQGSTGPFCLGGLPSRPGSLYINIILNSSPPAFSALSS